MFNAVEPIYKEFCRVLQGRFAREAFIKTHPDLPNIFGDKAENLFKTLEIGLSSGLRQNTITHNSVPYCALEWGQTNRVEGYRMPEAYAYELMIPVIVLASVEGNIPKNRQVQTVFPGVGEITQKLCGFFWREYHTGRFNDAVDPDSFEGGWDWSIVEFSMDVRNPYLVQRDVDTPLLQKLREILEANLLFRGTQMNFYFKIEERKPLD